jgi:hypothetical protein
MCRGLISWVVERSLDGEAWTEIDRRTDHNVFLLLEMASYPVSKAAECRFIRLTQTGKNHFGTNKLTINIFEFFGTLLE